MAVEVEIYEDFEKLLKDTKYDLAQNILSKALNLERITYTKIAIILWQQCVTNEMQHVFSSSYCTKRAAERLLLCMPTYCQGILEKVTDLMLTKYCEETLKLIICGIGYEIWSLLHHLLRHELLQYKTETFLKLYMNNLCWTQNGTINKLKTVEQLIDHNDMDILDKYLLACNFCLEDKARELIVKVPRNILDSFLIEYKNYLYHPYLLVELWTNLSFDGIENYNVLPDDIIIDAVMIKCSIFYESEASVQFLWENYATDEIKEVVLIDFAEIIREQSVSTSEFYGTKLNNKHILLYLLTKMNQVQLRHACVIMGYEILETIWNSLEWRHLLLHATGYIMKLYPFIDIADRFTISSFLCHKKLFRLVEYEQLWKQYGYHCVIHSKFVINVLEKFLLQPGLIIKCTNIVKGLMNICSDEWKKYLMEGLGINVCAILLWNEKLDIFNLFLNNMLTDNNILFKIQLFDKINNMICFTMIERNKYELLEEILAIFYCGEELEIFKRKLPYLHKSKLVLQIITRKDDNRLKCLETFLMWCFNGSTDEIQIFNRIVFDLRGHIYRRHIKSLFQHINMLIRREKCDLAFLGLKWIFYAVEVYEINTWNKKLTRIKIILYLAYGKNGGMLLRRYITFCFQENEVEMLKAKLAVSEKLMVIVKDMFQILHSERWFENVKNSLQELNNLLNWCFSSDKDKIYEFKKRFMFSKGYIILLNLITERRNDYKMVPLFEWFDPSIELANLFNKRFLRYLLANDKSIKEKYKSVKLSYIKYRKILLKRATVSLELLIKFAKHKRHFEDNRNTRKRLRSG